MTIIYLIRHSESMKSKNLVFESEIAEQLKNEKIPLSPDGEEKAKMISTSKELENIDAIFCSEYERAISTAKYIANKNNTNINISSKLNERKIGDAEDLPKSFWLTQLEDENAKAQNGENRKEVRERFLSYINELLMNYKNKRIVVVSHATAITFLLMNWCELVSANLEDKFRHLKFKDKDVINDIFRCPEIFKLSFDDNNNIENIELIREGD